MKTTLAADFSPRIATDLIVVPVSARGWESSPLKMLDAALGGRLRTEAQSDGFGDGNQTSFVFQTHGLIPARHVALVLCQATDAPASWYTAADQIVRTARTLRSENVVVALGDALSVDFFATLVEGTLLAAYRYTRYQSSPGPEIPVRVVFCPRRITAALQRAQERAEIAASATCFARDLVNCPAADMTPTALAEAAQGLVTRGIEVTIHSRRQIEKLGMGALLSVAQGSVQEPRFIEMTYRGETAGRKAVALAGKGVTFDSGGLNLKNADSMRMQKRDMAGAALLLGVMSALPSLQPRFEVRAYIPAVENMPSGSATRPGDVLRALNGKTIEVLNTDAEGRLILADALSYAVTKQPDFLFDFATLTAAVTTALGSRYAAILGTDQRLVDAVIAAGARSHERLWQLPLVDDYRRDLDSTIADIKNIGEGQAGTIIAALFLREFTSGLPWAHIDFSSTAFSNGYPCHPVGATGFGVRTMLRFLCGLNDRQTGDSRKQHFGTTSRSTARRFHVRSASLRSRFRSSRKSSDRS